MNRVLLCALLLLGLLPAWGLAADTQAPTVRITVPTAQSSLTTTALSLALGGTAHDNVKVMRVTWQTDRGTSGIAQGTISWTATIPLVVGKTRVTVKAFDATGRSGNDTLTATVSQSSLLQAKIDATPTSGTAPLAVQFIDSSDGSHNAWAWTFGDGSTSSVQSPSHTYQDAGSYSVSLTIHNASGGSSSVTRANYITVTGDPTFPPGPITVDWDYGGGLGDAFQMERCTSVAGQPCPMSAVAVIALQDRSWIDQQVEPTLDYCYRLAVLTASQVGPYSNVMCSP